MNSSQTCPPEGNTQTRPKRYWIPLMAIYSGITDLPSPPDEALLLWQGGLQCHPHVALMSADTSDEVIENSTERCEMSVDRRNHGSLALGAAAALLAFLLVAGASSAASATGTVVK